MSFLGTFTSGLPSIAAMATFKKLAECMVANNKVRGQLHVLFLYSLRKLHLRCYANNSLDLQ